MQLHTLAPAKGAVHKKIRIGRGEASGKGGTATKGNKGHQSRAGFKYKWSHEGGQMPLQRRIPKRGFKNPFRIKYRTFNLYQVDELAKKYGLMVFGVEELYMHKLICRGDKVKILGDGILEGDVAFKVHALTKKARAVLEQKACTIDILK